MQVRADPDRIQQVVWNLLSNAVKFTPSGGRVEVIARRDRDMVEIKVSDTGIGIRKEFLGLVFDRFRQAEAGSAREHGGLGLGLAIAKQLVELHHGSIVASSEGEGQGSTFTVRLPLPVRPALSEDPAATSTVHGDGLEGVSVLLVEDEAAARDTTRRLLQQFGPVSASLRSTRLCVQTAHVASTLLNERAWADNLDGLRDGSNVIPMRRAGLASP